MCLISTEFMGCGRAGGFGFATRSLGRELAARGVRVTVVLPQPRQVTGDHLTFDGVTVRTYPRLNLRRAADLLRECNADVYHSQEPSLATWIDGVFSRYLASSRSGGVWGSWGSRGAYHTKNGLSDERHSAMKS